MELEQQSRNESNAGAGILEPETATIAPSSANVDAWEADEPLFSIVEAKVDNLASVALSFPEIRLARVQALKAKIDAGTYQVRAEQVADALLEYMWMPKKAGRHRQSSGA